ncbi:V-type proton ATPase subunit c''1 [Fagus crenata]
MSRTVASAAIAGGASSWARVIVMISPYTFSAIGIAIAIGVSVLDAACKGKKSELDSRMIKCGATVATFVDQDVKHSSISSNCGRCELMGSRHRNDIALNLLRHWHRNCHRRLCPRRRLGYLNNWKQFLIGAAIKASRIASKNLISVISCEAVAIYGVIVAIILQTKLECVPKSQIYAPKSLRAGYAIFASGIIVGFANLVCGVCVGIIGSSCALSDAQNSTLFVKIFVIEIFGIALGLFGVIVRIIMLAQATWPAKAA